MIDCAAHAGLGRRIALKDDARVSEHQPLGSFRRFLSAEMLRVPIHGRGLIGGGQVDVIDHVREPGGLREDGRRRGYEHDRGTGDRTPQGSHRRAHFAAGCGPGLVPVMLIST